MCGTGGEALPPTDPGLFDPRAVVFVATKVQTKIGEAQVEVTRDEESGKLHGEARW